MKVEPIPSNEAWPWILKKHYAHRLPSIQYAFGLYDNNTCCGVVTYGPPPTPAIKEALFGGIWQDRVYELNRLCIDSDNKNAASILVGRSLRMLPTPSCIVSYADSGQGHVGYIYQATNFLFTGSVVAHDCEYIINGRVTHARTLTAKGITAPMKWAFENHIEVVRPEPKHRYIYLCGTKREKRDMLAKLAYDVLPYPKGESKRYDATATVEKQGILF